MNLADEKCKDKKSDSRQTGLEERNYLRAHVAKMIAMNDNRYDAWLQWTLTEKCNLDCVYCSTGQFVKKDARTSPLGNEIDVAATIKTLNNSNRTFLIGLTGGGEPFLVKNIMELCSEITKNHYIAFNTNLTSSKIKDFAERIDPTRVIYIVASLHIKELERLGLLERYIENFLFCKEKGFNIYAKEVAYPLLLSEVEKYKEFFENKGILLSFDPFCGEYNSKIYPAAYTAEEIKFFGLKDDTQNKYRQKGSVCNAGYNVGAVDFPAGNIHPCYGLLNEQIGNIYKEIEFNNNLLICPLEYCGCPLNIYAPDLFKKALKEIDLQALQKLMLQNISNCQNEIGGLGKR